MEEGGAGRGRNPSSGESCALVTIYGSLVRCAPTTRGRGIEVSGGGGGGEGATGRTVGRWCVLLLQPGYKDTVIYVTGEVSARGGGVDVGRWYPPAKGRPRENKSSSCRLQLIMTTTTDRQTALTTSTRNESLCAQQILCTLGLKHHHHHPQD